MLYDRPYMHTQQAYGLKPYLYWLMGALVACFALQMLFTVWGGSSGFISNWFVLSNNNLADFKVWTLVTYGFLHGSILHILANLLTIFFIGRALIPQLGHQRLTGLFFVMVVGGGIAHSLVHLFGYPTGVIGASAAALGLLVLFCLMHPGQNISLLLFFVLPVTLKTDWILWGAIAINVAGFAFGELPSMLGREAMGAAPIAWSAHLGGMLVAYLYYLFRLNPERVPSWLPRASVAIEPPRWARRKKSTAGGKVKLNLTNRSALKQEVDRILDKINNDGFASLSEEEKVTLEKAKDLLNP